MINPARLAQREKGLCEQAATVCPERATLIVTPFAHQLDSRRLCDDHGEPHRADPAYHVAEIRR